MGILIPMAGSQTLLSGALPSLFGKTRQALLGLLYARADEEHLQESLIQLAGPGRGTVQRELEFLARAGVVRRTVRGRQVYFHANPESPIYSELRGLVVKAGGVADVLRAALARAQDAIGREVNPSVFPPAEIRAKLAAKHHFLRSVLKGQKIFLIGDEHELARLAKE